MIDIPTGIAIGIAFTAVIIAGYSTYISKKTMRHHALLGVHKDYRSSEMLSALDGVWKFHRDVEKKHPRLKKDPIKFKEALKSEYETMHKQQRDDIAKNILEAEDSLNYKRRNITHFYVHLASVYNHKILPPDMIFDWWMPSDFKIFDDLIIPLQEAASKLSDTPAEETEFALKPLHKLKKACESYFEENKSDC